MRLLFFAGSTREGSYNKKLARLACRIAEANGAEAIFIDLKDYEMPLYNGDLEQADGPPQAARTFRALMGEYDGVFIACPEYNSSITPLLKNTLDWVSRVRTDGPDVYKSRVFAISSASPGYFGGMRGLLATRQVLMLGLGATVIPEQVVVPGAASAFDEDGKLKDDMRQKMLANTVEAFGAAARRFKS